MTITYFGYGSLVNADTVPSGTEVTPGKLRGWIREWKVCGTGENGVGRCALTVRQHAETEIWGVMAQEPRHRLDALEQREKRYDKVGRVGTAFRCDAADRPGPADLFLFRASPDHYRWGCEKHPVLQSYLDCVLSGYFKVWGEEGIDHFLRTTDGWHVPVLPDREAPHYPRKIVLDSDLAALFDDKLTALGVRYLQPGD